MAPTISLATKLGLIKPMAVDQKETFSAGIMFARTEGIIPAPESTHAIRAAIDLALKAKKDNEKKTIVFNLSGHGLLDMSGYDAYLSGKMNGDNM
jgi:tryptophan synthase beta chain